MSEPFSADWLALREPVDVRSRSGRLVHLLDDALAPDRTTRILDLASGTGSNARYVAPRLLSPRFRVVRRVRLQANLERPAKAGRYVQSKNASRQVARQRWVLADHDAALLARACELTPFEIATTLVDLSSLDPDASWLEGHDVITASALLDLVSEVWLQTLLRRCHELRAHVLFALNYDGRIECFPRSPQDERVRELVNQHQRTDKGFGRALGPEAARTTAAVLTALNYSVEDDSSEWVLRAGDAELQRQLIDGWAGAASQMAPNEAGQIEEWRARRQHHVARGDSRIIVGHEDVLGLAPVR